jgi:hypothetical protein
MRDAIVRLSRRDLLVGASAMGLGMGALSAPVRAETEEVLTEALVLRDPAIPVAGNASGDVSIVEYFDYQCPYCRKVDPELQQVVHDDGKIRLVWKDWPVLGPMSVTAARMAQASKYQDKFIEAHDAVVHCREIPHSRRADHGAIHASRRRRTKSGRSEKITPQPLYQTRSCVTAMTGGPNPHGRGPSPRASRRKPRPN